MSNSRTLQQPSKENDNEGLRADFNARAYIIWQLVNLLRTLKVEELTGVRAELVEAQADLMAAKVNEQFAAHTKAIEEKYYYKGYGDGRTTQAAECINHEAIEREARIAVLREVIDNPGRKAYFMELLNQELKAGRQQEGSDNN